MPRSARDVAIIIILLGISVLVLFSAPNDPQAGIVSRIVFTALRPFQQVIFTVHGRIKGIWLGYIALVNIRAENEALKNENERLRREKTALLGKEEENKRLKKFLELKTRRESPSIVAQVVAEDAAGWFKTFFVNRGTDDGITPNLPVIVTEGVVGKTSKTSAEISRVVLLTDPNISVDCRVARTGDRGILSGSLDKGCVLRYLSLQSSAVRGDEVVTSGLDGVFPRGVPVGKIEQVRKGPQGLFLEAQVNPAVDLSEVEEVLVLLSNRGGFDIQPGLDEKN